MSATPLEQPPFNTDQFNIFWRQWLFYLYNYIKDTNALGTDSEVTLAAHLIDYTNSHNVTLEQARSENSQLSGNIDANSNKITNLAASTTNGDSVRRRRFTVTIDPASVGANTTDEQTFTVSGVATGNGIIVNKPSHTIGLGIVNARVSATNTIAITFMNTTISSIDPPSEAYLITIFE